MFLFATAGVLLMGSKLIFVSIPGGICSSLRLDFCPLSTTFFVSFNPRRDLFLFATEKITVNWRFAYTFQSQAGFVPLCDHLVGLERLLHYKVSIPGGICSSLRHRSRLSPSPTSPGFNPRRDLFLFATWHGAGPTENRTVSIPGGICSSLRRGPGVGYLYGYPCFNPRRDLFLFATCCIASIHRA